MAGANKNKIIQGSFPGGMPHRSVIKLYELPAFDILIRNKQSGNFNNTIIQNRSAVNTFKIDPHRINFNNSGIQLPKEVIQKMESVFKTDFSSVRIHTNGGQAESIGALAFTTGSDIYFAAGQYNPHSPNGQRLLGHELTHVVQQRNGRVKNPFGNEIAVVNDHGLEAEAERMSLQILQDGLQEQRRISSLPNSIQSQIKKEIQRFSSVAKPASKNSAEQIPAANSNDSRIRYQLPMNIIQMSVDTDLNDALRSIQIHEYFTNGTLPELIETYPEITKRVESLNEELAGYMASGLKAWAGNYENKTKAYLLEARKALDHMHPRKGTVSILGINTNNDPDISVVNFIDEELLTSKSIELKSSDSGHDAVADLVREGIKQLRKREVVGNTFGINYDKHLLVVNLNAINHYPFTDLEWGNSGDYFGNLNPYDLSIFMVQTAWNYRLAQKISPFIGEQGFARPIEVRMQYKGKNYASFST